MSVGHPNCEAHPSDPTESRNGDNGEGSFGSELTGCNNLHVTATSPMHERKTALALKSALQASKPILRLPLTEDCALGYRRPTLWAWIANAGTLNH